jgi:hypothetical protein
VNCGRSSERKKEDGVGAAGRRSAAARLSRAAAAADADVAAARVLLA